MSKGIAPRIGSRVRKQSWLCNLSARGCVCVCVHRKTREYNTFTLSVLQHFGYKQKMMIPQPEITNAVILHMWATWFQSMLPLKKSPSFINMLSSYFRRDMQQSFGAGKTDKRQNNLGVCSLRCRPHRQAGRPRPFSTIAACINKRTSPFHTRGEIFHRQLNVYGESVKIGMFLAHSLPRRIDKLASLWWNLDSKSITTFIDGTKTTIYNRAKLYPEWL